MSPHYESQALLVVSFTPSKCLLHWEKLKAAGKEEDAPTPEGLTPKGSHSPEFPRAEQDY